MLNRPIQALVLALAVILGSGTGASAQQQGATGTASLTIYSQNLALVRTGLDRILEPGFHTVEIGSLPTNFDQTSLMVTDYAVTLLGVRDYRTYQGATSGPGAAITIDIEVSERIDELSLVFMTSGMGWSASYSMIIAPDDASAQIDGYATILNNSGTRFDDAEVQLLAGTINQQGAPGGRYDYASMDQVRALAEGMAARAPGMSQASFGGYHLYTVTERLSLVPGESRRIRMWGANSVATVKEYVLGNSINYYQQYPEPMTQTVIARYRMTRPEGTEFGDVPLPSGSVRVFQADAEGRLQLLGVAGIPNTPKEQELLLTTGIAFDIVGTRTQTEFDRTANNTYESAWRIELTNESDEDVVVQVVERLSGDWSIMNSSHSFEKISAGSALFRVRVPAGGKATLEYRVSVQSG